eukprot:2431658-Amphidinium_carterae.7
MPAALPVQYCDILTDQYSCKDCKIALAVSFLSMQSSCIGLCEEHSNADPDFFATGMVVAPAQLFGKDPAANVSFMALQRGPAR